MVDSTNDCDAIDREKARRSPRLPTEPPPPGGGGDDGPGGDGGNPGGGANPNPNCTENPDDLRCKPDCSLNPSAPGCPQITYGPECLGQWEDKNGNGSIDEGECDIFAFSGPPGSGSVTTTHTRVSSARGYVIGLRAQSTVTVSLTKMTRDFDCRGVAGNGLARTSRPRGASAPASWSCSNRGGRSDDSWSGTLPAGEHTITVWPHGGGGAGNYTLSVAIVEKLIPPPPTGQPPSAPSALTCPKIPDFRLPSGGTVNTVFPAATGGTAPYAYALSGQPPGISFASSTRKASGTLPTATTDTKYTVTYACSDSAAASSSVTFSVTVLAPPPPAAPSLSGSISGQTQTVSWNQPADDGITRYQLQTRSSSAHAWRFTDAGTPSPSSNIGPSARSWSVVTPWTLYRQYRVRATNAAGDGAWSNVVELTTPAAPPPPLSLPAIPDFPRLPSGGAVNTPFPAATGGVAPYSYRLSGLPPGLSFTPSTRTARGTLPRVGTATTYRIVYTVTDGTGRSASVTFSATVVP